MPTLPTRLLPLVFLLSGACALAQTPPPSAPLQREETPLDRHTQKVERIHVEDAGSKVDEVRVGGQTQSITVQPKAAVPEYEVQPLDGVRARAPARDTAGGGSGPRVWNVLKF